MNRDKDTILAEAATWHAASVHDDMDWDGFTAWLEADARHQAAYDEIALADSLLDDHRVSLLAASAPLEPPDAMETCADEPAVLRPAFARWKGWAGIAIAASLVAVLAIPQFLEPAAATYDTAASPRSIALADGSTVTLAPHSKLTVEGRQQERIALSGGAWFDIKHDPSRPMAISAGSVQISDIGTRFDVQATSKHVRVEVAEGAVQVASQTLSQPVRLTKGRGLLFDSDGGTALIIPLSDDNIGEWRQGRLSYDSAPLPLVAADLSRYAGVRVIVPAPLRNRQFSGTLVLGDGEAAIRDLSQVLGLELSHSAGGYKLGER